MPCLDENQLLQYVEGLLSPAEARALEEHLSHCAECRYLLSAAGAATAAQEAHSAAPTQVKRVAEIAPPARADDEHIGAVLDGTYVIERFLGKGGMGAVYEASHRRLPRRFAIKFITGASDDDEAIARMRREAMVTSGLSHPNIIQVTDFNYTEAGEPYLVMEYLEGEPLAERLRREGSLRDLTVVRAIAEQVASALKAAHREGIVHRDLTPGNIFLCHVEDDALPRVKVMDFGLSKVVAAGPVRSRLKTEDITRVVSVMGSPYYMSPEQAQGRSATVDHRADIFSFGAILYRMLSGHVPFSGADEYEIQQLIAAGTVSTSPSWEVVPECLRTVVLRALRKDPAQRPPSVAELISELSAALASLGVGGPLATTGQFPKPLPLPPEEETWRPVRLPPPRKRQRRALTLSVAGALAVGTVLALAVALYPADGPDPRGSLIAAASDDARGDPSATVDAAPAATPNARTADAALAWHGDRSPADAALAATPDARSAHPLRGRPRRPRPATTSPRPRFGTLNVQTTSIRGRPLWADVLLDGKNVGQTALTLEHVPEGLRQVTVRRPGYATATRRVRVRADQRARVRFTLHELGAQ